MQDEEIVVIENIEVVTVERLVIVKSYFIFE